MSWLFGAVFLVVLALAEAATHGLMGGAMVVKEEVSLALKEGRPVVVLESTIVAHGMPFPQNLETAIAVENVVREYGAIPATIAVLDGVVHIGLSVSELESLARKGSSVNKASRRDLAVAVGGNLDAATTVSATSLLASRAGIDVFVTGGIGGVHRGFESTMDVSADLTELGRTKICVVSAGVKSILDIPRTLEYLETQGVTVIGYRTDTFPAFFTPKSNSVVPLRLDTPEQCANVILANELLDLQSGILVAVPIPEEEAPEGDMVESVIEAVLNEAKEQGITGRDITPFVLKRNNAKIGAQIAVALSQRRALKTNVEPRHPIVLFGGSIIDISSRTLSSFNTKTKSNSGDVSLHNGGVGRNIAEALTRLGEDPLLVSAVGQDEFGDLILSQLKALKMSTRGILVGSQDHPVHTAVFNNMIEGATGDSIAIAETSIFDVISSDYISLFTDDITSSQIVILDGNVPVEAIGRVCDIAHSAQVPVWFEPATAEKSKKALHPRINSNCITYISPNREELISLASASGIPVGEAPEEPASQILFYKELGEKLFLPFPSLRGVLVKLGKLGALTITPTTSLCNSANGKCLSTTFSTEHFAAHEVGTLVDATGAGDCMAAAIIAHMLPHLRHNTNTPYNLLPAAMQAGLRAAKLSVESEYPVSHLLNSEVLRD
ncbi:pseudouridine-metabolizing bifunctional protein C1861.05 [Pelomyxa schiedti]|nr:pseudouridine-metabolizing bifunctional protein C1861.05 [Pelomyxa schiedti]